MTAPWRIRVQGMHGDALGDARDEADALALCDDLAESLCGEPIVWDRVHVGLWRGWVIPYDGTPGAMTFDVVARTQAALDAADKTWRAWLAGHCGAMAGAVA